MAKVFCSIAQESISAVSADTCIQRDVSDAIRAALKKPPKTDSASNSSLLLIPIIGSNPATGFMVGIALQYGLKLPGETTNFSMISGSVQFTAKSQKLFQIKNNIYTKNNNIFFSGDWRYLVFSQSTYGLGTNAPEGGILDYQYSLSGAETNTDSLAQPINYNFLRFHQSASFRILKRHEGFFVGVGYALDHYSKIEDQKLSLEPGDTVITSHYAYNTFYGFSTDKYYVSTLKLNFIWDTRDNMINPYSGHFLMVEWRGGPKFLGNKDPANYFSAEWRSFHSLSPKNPRHLLAF